MLKSGIMASNLAGVRGGVVRWLRMPEFADYLCGAPKVAAVQAGVVYAGRRPAPLFCPREHRGPLAVRNVRAITDAIWRLVEGPGGGDAEVSGKPPPSPRAPAQRLAPPCQARQPYGGRNSGANCVRQSPSKRPHLVAEEAYRR